MPWQEDMDQKFMGSNPGAGKGIFLMSSLLKCTCTKHLYLEVLLHKEVVLYIRVGCSHIPLTKIKILGVTDARRHMLGCDTQPRIAILPLVTVETAKHQIMSIRHDNPCVAFKLVFQLPSRPAGVWVRMARTRSSSSSLRFCSAGKKPGAIALTRMPFGASSRARYWVRLFNPALATE